MFHSARLRLTFWYLVIIMIVTFLFSGVIYANVNEEYTRIERFEKLRQEDEKKNLNSQLNAYQIQLPPNVPMPIRMTPRKYDPKMIQQSRMRLLVTLALVDGSVLFLSGFAGYFLAGRTLKPIQDMMAEQNRFVTDASHEIRTPLTSIKSSTEVNLRNPKLTLIQAKNTLESNLEEVNNLQLLSDNLIQLTQYPNGSSQSFTPYSLETIVTDAVKKVGGLAKTKQIILKKMLIDAPVLADKQSLIELFVIILDNAIKYSPEKSTITITTKNPDGKMVTTISDEGIGIDQKDLLHIFDRFYRVDKSRTKIAASGYGLGLSIAQHIATIHHGEITVTSTVGKGTTFTITLPKSA